MVKLYSTGCPKCKILKTKLDKANIQYETISDINEMLEKGFDTVPVLVVENNIMEFVAANNWINEVLKHGN